MGRVENHATYLARFAEYPLQDRRLIDFAYRLAKDAHRRDLRDTGERYFEHLRAVSTIIFDEFNLRDTSYFISATLHDAGEDTSIFGSTKNQTYSQWRDEASFLLRRIFGAQVEEMVLAVTRPFVDGIEVVNKHQAEEMGLSNLRVASPEAKILKMSDRLHNLRTLAGVPDSARKQRKIKETEDHYMPIFELVGADYPVVEEYAIAQMRQAIISLS